MTKGKNLILLLNSFWNSQQGMSGGDQIVVQTYSRIWPRFIQIYCLTNFDGSQIFSTKIKNINFLLTDKLWDRQNILINYLARTIFALKCLKIKDIHLVHSSSDFIPDVLPGFIYKIINPSVKWGVNVMHIYPDWRSRPGGKIYNLIASMGQKISLNLIKKSDQIIVLNKQVKSDLVQLGFLANKVTVIPAGLDTRFISSVSVKKSTPKYDVTFMARLKPSKGIFDLVKIWQAVLIKKPKFKIAVMGGAGDPEILSRLTTEIKRGKLQNNIKLLGFLDRVESYAVIKASRVFISLSHEEGFSITMAEALACGTPVVAWDLPVYREVYGSTISYVSENDYLQFAHQIIKLTDSPEVRQKMIRIGQKYVLKFNWDKTAASYSQLFLGR